MNYPELPLGLLGISPRNPIGVKVNCGIRSRERGGAPTAKDRFWLMTPESATEKFGSSSEMARQLHPAFAAWNKLAMAGSEKKRGDARLGTLRGNIVHHAWQDAATWNRAAQKLPSPHQNPPSRRPACQGNGISATRYEGSGPDGERYASIACPNRMCQFAMNGACKPFGGLLFQLRWSPTDPFEREFQPLLALWTTRGWRSLENLVGLLEYVLGTEAILTAEDREHSTADQRTKWRPGLAAGLGIKNPSVFGLPFTMTISERTSPAKQARYSVVSFSPDGNLMEWLSLQMERREALVAGASRLALPSIRAAEVRPYLDESLREFDPANSEPVPPEPETPGLDPSDGPAEVSGSGVVLPSQEEGISVEQGGEVPSTTRSAPVAERADTARGPALTDAAPEVAQEPPGPPQPRRLAKEARARIYQFAGERGLDSVELERVIGKPIDQTDLDELAILGKIRSWKSPAKGKRS